MSGEISDLDLCSYQAESFELLLTRAASKDFKKTNNPPKIPNQIKTKNPKPQTPPKTPSRGWIWEGALSWEAFVHPPSL